MNVPVKVLLCSLFCAGVFVVFSCNKNTFTSNTPTSPNYADSADALWPLKAGNAWIYQDSVFSDSSTINSFADTIKIGTLTESFGGGGPLFYQLIDPNPNGWFTTGSYMAVDAYNTTIYESDSLSNSPYICFQTALQDGTLIGSANDFVNPTCIGLYSLYGFATETAVANHVCMKNIEYTVDCNHITQEAVVMYISQGIGLVRIEDYLATADSTHRLYLGYSQTLQSYTLGQ